MAFPFMKKETLAAGKGFPPTERVRELSSKGFSEIDIIDVLRREGFSPEEIDKALTETTKNEVSATRPSLPKMETEERLPTLDDILPPAEKEMPVLPESSLPEGYYQSQPYQTEEFIDYVVQERVRELNEKFIEFSVRTEELDKRIASINERVEEIMRIRSTEQTQVITKIDSFKDSVTEIDMRIGSLEKAFKETLPALIESVRALSDIVQRFKREA
jgi:DNA-binding transcriptional MerR regulator